MRLPRIGSVGLPYCAGGPAVRDRGIDRVGFLQPEERLPRLHRGRNRFAVDSANFGRLNAFAVLAFCAEITRLPGH